MAATEIKVQMQQRRDTASGWTSENPTLLSGEFGYETDTDKFKVGDGSTAWNSLAYIEGMSIQNYPIDTADIANDAVTAAKLANTAVTAGSYTAADITVDAQGRITSAASGTISTAEIANDAVTAAKLANTAVTAGSYTAADITVDAQGRITAAANGSTDADTLDGLNSSSFVRSDADDTGTGGYSTTGSYWEVGEGGGSVALTTNDGYGNANLTFNHRSGTPDQDGNAARIQVNTDSTSNANIAFQVKSNVTNGTAVSATVVMQAYETYVNFPVGLSFDDGTYVMDEYEEGTFTPEYDPAAGGWGPTYDQQNGDYIRIGDVCHFRLRLRTDDLGVSNASGNVNVAGLPFTSRTTTAQAVSIYSTNFPTGDNPYMAWVLGNSTEIYIYKMNATIGDSPVRINVDDFGNGTNDNQVYIAGSYQVQ